MKENNKKMIPKGYASKDTDKRLDWLSEKIGFDYVCVTSGGIIPKTNLKFKPGYQVFLAKKVKEKSKIITRTAGMIKDINHAEEIVKNKKADLVSFGRKFISSPNWLINELLNRNYNIKIPNQYKRCF